MTLIKTIKSKFIRWRDQRRLITIRKLTLKVFRNELPGNVIKHNDKELVVMDIVMSIRKNEIKAVRTPLTSAFTKRQRAAINWQIKLLKKRSENVNS